MRAFLASLTAVAVTLIMTQAGADPIELAGSAVCAILAFWAGYETAIYQLKEAKPMR